MPRKNLTFEQALQQLEVLVREMESGDLPLEVCMKHYESGVELAAFCQKALENAKLKISELKPASEPDPFDEFIDENGELPFY